MSTFEKILKFLETMFIWGKYRFKRNTKDVIDHRATICQGSKNNYIKSTSCDEWNPNSYFKLGNCKVCGCTRGKWYVPNSECPLGKWKSNVSGSVENLKK